MVANYRKAETAKEFRIEEKSSSKYNFILVLSISIITFFCYHNSLHNQFTNWDDNRLIVNNSYIKNLTPENRNMILFHDITGDYYMPVNMISYAINYHFSKLNPFAYYLTNIIVHVLNTMLIFFLTIMLLEAMEKSGYGNIGNKHWLAAWSAILYGIHPMHVESVSWAAERKDVLYAFFYFMGLITYIRYINGKQTKWLIYVGICFVLSLLSKPMAVVFPFSLIALDVLLKRDKVNTIRNLITEKTPFLLISVISGIGTVYLQTSGGAIAAHNEYDFFHKILFAGYGFTMYSVKAFVPFSLCSFYPYPPILGSQISLSAIFYIAPFLAIAIIGIPLYISYRAGANNFRVVLASMIFYVFNLIFVLQIISVGPNVMAERYSYVSYFGIFFPLVYFVHKLLAKYAAYKTYIWIFLVAYSCILAYICYNRTMVWHDSETLWKDVVKKYPGESEIAYNSLGAIYYEKGDMDNAYDNFKVAIDMHSTDPHVYCNMGVISFIKKQYDQAFTYFNKSLQLDSNNIDTYIDLAVSYSAIGNYPLALAQYAHANRIDPNSEKLLQERAYTYLNTGQFDNAITDYSRAIQIDPDRSIYYLYRGQAKFNKGDVKEALADFMHTINLEPGNANCLFNISISYRRMEDYKNALKYAMEAQQAGYQMPDGYISMLQQNAN